MIKMYFLCCSYRTRIKDHGIIKLRVVGIDKQIRNPVLIFFVNQMKIPFKVARIWVDYIEYQPNVLILAELDLKGPLKRVHRMVVK